MKQAPNENNNIERIVRLVLFERQYNIQRNIYRTFSNTNHPSKQGGPIVSIGQNADGNASGCPEKPKGQSHVTAQFQVAFVVVKPKFLQKYNSNINAVLTH